MTTTTTDRAGRVGDVAIKAPVVAATTAAITLSGEQTIDGVLTAASRVLVKNQAGSIGNGIYLSDTGTWTRAADWDGPYDAANGTLVHVNGGTANSGFWYAVGTDPIVVGTSAVTWASSNITELNLDDATWLAVTPQPNVPWLSNGARTGAYSTTGGISVSGVARSSDSGASPTGAAIGVAGFAYNDNTSTPKAAWGGYLESKRVNGSGFAVGLEIDATNLGVFLAAGPYTNISGSAQMSIGAWIVSGGDPVTNPVTADATAGVAIASNGARWGTGLLFKSDSLRDQSSTFGTYATQVAIAMARDQGLHWVNPDGNRAAHISSLCGAGQKSLGLAFVSTSARFVDDQDIVQAQIYKTASANSYLSLTGNAAASPELVASSDAVADVDITLTAKGSGKVRTQAYFKNDRGIALSPHATKTADYTVTTDDTVLTCNKAGIFTLTLPTPSSFPGRILVVRTITANTVVSAGNNVVPAAGGAAGTAILAATAGKAALLMSDGTNWQNILAN